LHAPSIPNLPIAQTRRVIDGAFAMQAAACGHRLGISGQFRETFGRKRGAKRPTGPALVLLDVVQRRDIAAIL
jgi:DNA-binding transcriptional regulator YiaG